MMNNIKTRKFRVLEPDGIQKYYKLVYSLDTGDIFRLHDLEDGSTIDYLVLDRYLLDRDPIDRAVFEYPVPFYCLLRMKDESVVHTPLAKTKRSYYELLA